MFRVLEKMEEKKRELMKSMDGKEERILRLHSLNSIKFNLFLFYKKMNKLHSLEAMDLASNEKSNPHARD